MRTYRVMLMLAALLALVSAVQAQTPPPPLPERLIDPPQEGRFDSPGYPKQAYENANSTPGVVPTYGRLTSGPETAATAGWHMQAWQHMVTAWQRARSMCASNQSDAACCDAAAKAAKCVAGVAGSVRCCEVAQAPKTCACAKACACCEMCKAKKDEPARTQAQPTRPDMMQRIAGLHGITPPPPFPVIGLPPCLPPAQGAGIVQVVPVPGVRVIQVMQIAHAVKPVHFVTPEIDAHCERMHHHGDMVILEGNVLLLCKKHAQPIRIEAQRVLINMKDGSFSVQSEGHPMPPMSNFGVQRPSAAAPAVQVITGKRLIVDQQSGRIVESAPVASPAPTRGMQCPLEGLYRLMQPPAPRAERIFQLEIEPIPGR